MRPILNYNLNNAKWVVCFSILSMGFDFPILRKIEIEVALECLT
jgi:hypothetical protein